MEETQENDNGIEEVASINLFNGIDIELGEGDEGGLFENTNIILNEADLPTGLADVDDRETIGVYSRSPKRSERLAAFKNIYNLGCCLQVETMYNDLATMEKTSKYTFLAEGIKLWVRNYPLKEEGVRLLNKLSNSSSTSWPEGFEDWVSKNRFIRMPASKWKERNKNLIVNRPDEVISEIYLGWDVLKEFQNSRVIINNFLNPNFPSQFKSGYTAASYLSALRKGVYEKVSLATARQSVTSKLNRPLKSGEKSLVLKEGETKDMKIQQRHQELINAYDNSYYPDCFLTFLLLGKPHYERQSQLFTAGQPIDKTKYVSPHLDQEILTLIASKSCRAKMKQAQSQHYEIEEKKKQKIVQDLLEEKKMKIVDLQLQIKACYSQMQIFEKRKYDTADLDIQYAKLNAELAAVAAGRIFDESAFDEALKKRMTKSCEI